MRIGFNVTGTSVSDARLESNISHARSLGLPSAERRAGGGVLNVIGRGPSVARHAEFLRKDSADNWACGTAWAWCRDNGIDATAVFADPNPRMAQYAVGCRFALVSEQCDPALFEELKFADVRLMSLEQWAVGYSAASIAAVLGCHPDTVVRLYGCEGSYEATTHANEDIPQKNEIWVRCNGEVFRTNSQMIIQCEEFVWLFHWCIPGLFENHSGGLLGAMLATGGEWDFERWDNAPSDIQAAIQREKNTGNPGWGDDGHADVEAFKARAAQ